ncbi:MAG: hypothetical protein LVQ64_04840 [Thermoplasmatales archaeon]|nr:hypothetical protein [Thermoplasmatales archaeon]
MKHRRSLDPRDTILLCPQCRSARLVYEAGLITGQVYRCQTCGYMGSFVIEMDTPDPNAPLDESKIP